MRNLTNPDFCCITSVVWTGLYFAFTHFTLAALHLREVAVSSCQILQMVVFDGARCVQQNGWGPLAVSWRRIFKCRHRFEENSVPPFVERDFDMHSEWDRACFGRQFGCCSAVKFSVRYTRFSWLFATFLSVYTVLRCVRVKNQMNNARK